MLRAIVLVVLQSSAVSRRLETALDTAQSLLETSSTDDVSMFHGHTIATFEDAAVDEKTEMQQWCTSFSSMDKRTYHYELVYPDGERTAMELLRDPRDPVIRFYKGRTWAVRFANFTNGHTGLSWRPVEPDSEGRPVTDAQGRSHSDFSNPLAIDVRKDLAYIKRIPASSQEEHSVDAIEFGFLNGTTMRFAGGLYYPEKAMERSLRRAFEERKSEIHEGRVTTQRHNAEGRELDAAGFRTVVNSTKQFIHDLVKNAEVSAGLAFVFTFWPAHLATLGWSISAGFAAVGASVLSATYMALPFMVPMALWSSIHSWRHERRELSMTASEKMFEKFSCHRMIGVCDGADLAGQDSIFMLAAAGRPHGNVLVPFNGDIDVVTNKPFPLVVPWTTPISNEGNIGCTDPRLAL